MRTIIRGVIGLLAGVLVGCGEGKDAVERVVLYTAIDRPYAEAIVADFEKETGIDVELRTDDEGSKTAGLANKLIAEKDNVQADVWWSNEVFHTLRLADAGVLEPYAAATAGEIDEVWKHPLYTPVGLRARVIVVNTDPAHAEAIKDIARLEDLLSPGLRGKVAVANPRFGTTGGHVASLYQIMGEAEADALFRGLHDNGVAVLGSNSEVVRYVSAGQMIAGLTDNDDVHNAQSQDKPVRWVIPDQGDGQRGTLLIPTTVAQIKGARNAENAKKLIDYLTSKATEQKLIEQGFALYSVRDGGGEVQTMSIDFAAAAKEMEQTATRAEKLMRGE